MLDDLKERLEAATQAIVDSSSPRRLIVAGPGTGKTFTFKSLLGKIGSSPKTAVVMTFINNLKDDLERDLDGLAQVSTFHAFCLGLLHRQSKLRGGLTDKFEYFPPVMSLIGSDWKIAKKGSVPKFIGLMRQAKSKAEVEFYLARSDYYDAVSFDDSVYRAYLGLQEHAAEIPRFDLVLVDEYQDFNQLEASFIDLLAAHSPIAIAGDDDQALYAFDFRGSSPDFLRSLHESGKYELLELPFSLRCTEPIVGAVHDVLRGAASVGNLSDRISKPYEYYPPHKEEDSRQYPNIKAVRTSVQSLTNNYFGRYILEQIRLIPTDEIKESHAEYFPTVVVIGPRQYLRQVQGYLEAQGYTCEGSEPGDPTKIVRFDVLQLLAKSPESNLGWRAVIELDNPSFAKNAIRESIVDQTPLHQLLPEDYITSIKAEIAALPDEPEAGVEVSSNKNDGAEDLSPTIRLTTYEGSKGLSGQHVFIVGLQNGDLPRKPKDISDLDICKFLVALTRTRKQCHLLHTSRWGAKKKQQSVFVSWVSARTENLYVTKEYWKNP